MNGIRLTPAEIVEQAKEAKAHVVGLSIPFRLSRFARARRGAEAARGGHEWDVPVVVGGIIPAEDVNVLKQCGASAVYTPKDFPAQRDHDGHRQSRGSEGRGPGRGRRADAAHQGKGVSLGREVNSPRRGPSRDPPSGETGP